jgi:magnesium chelatase accessory protein
MCRSAVTARRCCSSTAPAPPRTPGATSCRGCSGPPQDGRYGLDDLARGLGALLTALDLTPAIVAGNSAGAAIVARLSLDARAPPAQLISFNGALLPLSGVSGVLFPPLAKLAALSPWVAFLFARSAADRRAVERMVHGTGSTLDATGIDLYQRRSPGHVESVISMMAHWRLERLAADLPGLKSALTLVVGLADRIVPPATAETIQRLLPSARLERLPGLGHLLHEEDAAAAARCFNVQ